MVYLLAGMLLISCNNSTKKTSNQAMDDTARYENPTHSSNFTEIIAYRLMERDIQGITYKGMLRDAYKWNDKLGENILITSVVWPYKDSKPDEYGELGQSAELYAYHYTKKGKGFAQVWVMKDGVKSCAFDITNNYISDAATITDLDKNGIAEIKVQYFTACRSDVSPAEHKLVMYENGKKYALKGLSWLAYSPDLKFDVTVENANLEKLGKTNIDNDEDYVRAFGRYENEKDFASANPSFLEYARTEWVRYVKEKIGE